MPVLINQRQLVSNLLIVKCGNGAADQFELRASTLESKILGSVSFENSRRHTAHAMLKEQVITFYRIAHTRHASEDAPLSQAEQP